MSITKTLLALDPTLGLHNESEWSNNSEKSLYCAFNDAGVECEVGEFLYAMVRILKPRHVLETGTHWGIGASYMGLALKENNRGHLDTVEFLPEIWEVACERIRRLKLDNFVSCCFQDASEFIPSRSYDLIVLDTEPQTRYQELIQFFPALNEGGFVFIHDLHRHMGQIKNEEHEFAWPFGKLPKKIKEWVKNNELKPFHFPTPRGLTGFYKSHTDDYKYL